MGSADKDCRLALTAGLFRFGGLFAVYLAASAGGLSLAGADSPLAIFWVANGLAIGWLLRSGGVASGSVAVFLASVTGNLIFGGDLVRALGFAAANAAEVAMAVLLCRWAAPSFDATRPRHLGVFVLSACILAPALSGTLGAQVAIAGTTHDWASVWVAWTLADALGNLIAAPVLTILLCPGDGQTRPSWPWLVACLAAQAVVLAVILSAVPTLWPLVAVQVLTVLRCGAVGGAASLAITTVVIAIAAGQYGFRPVEGLSPLQSALFVQAFLATLALVTLVMVATLARRERLASDLLASERRWKLAIEGSDEGFWEWDVPTGRLSYNARWALRMGYTPGQGAQTLEEFQLLVHPEDRARLDAAVIAHLKGRAPFYEIDFRFRAADDAWIWICLRGHVFERAADGTALRVAGTLTDVSARRAAADELRSAVLAERESRMAHAAFLVNVAHELRTPLNSVIGFSEIMERQMFGPLPERYHEYATDIADAGRHLVRMINDLLDLSRLDVGRLSLEEDEVGVVGLVHSAVRIVDPQARTAQVELRHEIADGLSAVRGDATRLRQILLNLLANAVKFTPRGGQVTVRAFLDGRVPIFEVRDTGIGIAAEDIPRVLEPYEQVRNAHTRAQIGTGLGLPLSRRLAALHGGRLEIESAPGQGTAVRVVLPPDRLIERLRAAA